MKIINKNSDLECYIHMNNIFSAFYYVWAVVSELLISKITFDFLFHIMHRKWIFICVLFCGIISFALSNFSKLNYIKFSK